MELWIRSQDKWDLVTARHIKMRIEGDFSNIYCGITLIGTYKTMKRALEVLDEIHQRLINLQCIELIGAANITQQMKRNGVDCVYEMPKE